MYTPFINCNACKFCSATELANFVMIPVFMAASSPFSREIRKPSFGLVLALATVLASLMKTGLTFSLSGKNYSKLLQTAR